MQSRIFLNRSSHPLKVFPEARQVTQSASGGETLLVGGGFTPSQMRFLIPLLDGFATEQGVKKWVFLDGFPKELVEHKLYEKILQKYELVVLPTRPFSSLKTGAFSLLCLSRIFLGALTLVSRANREGLAKKRDWHDYQVIHAVWDSTLQRTEDGTISPNVWQLFRSSMQVEYTRLLSRKVVKKYQPNAAFIGHTVYQWRALAATLRDLSVDVFAHGGEVIYRLPRDYDNSWSVLSEIEWQTQVARVSQKEVQKFWNQRLKGISTYSDASLAGSGNQATNKDDFTNVVFLHIFRDSPFNLLDPNRIFVDYVDWVGSTLKILQESQESWVLRLHPSADRWGENQELWLRGIAEKVYGSWDKLPPHIKIQSPSTSNISVLTNARRVVTYSGTTHLEAAAMGLRPIIISAASLLGLSRDLVHYPENVGEYRDLLLRPSSSAAFLIDDHGKMLARKGLFVREERLSFGPEVQPYPVYRGDSRERIQEHLRKTEEAVSRQFPYFRELGESLARGEHRTYRMNAKSDA